MFRTLERLKEDKRFATKLILLPKMNRILSAVRPFQSLEPCTGRTAERIVMKETAAKSMGIGLFRAVSDAWTVAGSTPGAVTYRSGCTQHRAGSLPWAIRFEFTTYGNASAAGNAMRNNPNCPARFSR